MEDSHSFTKKMLRKRDLMGKPLSCGFDISNDNIEEIRNCEREIRILNEQERECKLNVFREYMSFLKPLFNVRLKIIESIPKFWATVVEYQPKLSYLISEEVIEILQYLNKLEVDNVDPENMKITLVFDENPYIENKVVIKEFSSCNGNELVSATTPINWKRNLIQEKNMLETEGGRKRKSENISFFTWFCDDDREDTNLIMNCFDEMWQNPLPFFIWGIMDSKLEDFDDVSNRDLDNDIDTNEDDENVFENDDRSSEAMDDDDFWSEIDEEESEKEDEVYDSEFDEGEEERYEDMDDDIDDEV